MAIIVEKSTTPKLTKSAKFDMLLSVLNGNAPTEENKEMLAAFIEREKELLAKKKVSSAAAKKHENNTRLSDIVRDILANATAPLTIDEIKACNSEFAGRNPQFMTALIYSLIPTEVEKTVIKKKAHYSIVGKFTSEGV